VRSRAAASVLQTAGFETVHSMMGGINAWEGLRAAGAPDSGMSFFPAAAGTAELLGLAWLLEEGSRRFYSSVAGTLSDNEAASLFTDLTAAEVHHKEALAALYRDMSGAQPGPGFPGGVIPGGIDEDRMEGGVKVSEALVWVKGKSARDVLDLSLSLETDSYDLYIKMRRKVTDEKAKKVFDVLINEENEHLARMAALLDRKL
jgi:rubrerythrin